MPIVRNKPCVVIAEPNKVERETLAYLLNLHNYGIIEASSFDEAVSYSSLNVPDVIITEYDFPGGRDGQALIKILKENTRLKHIPILVVSNNKNEAVVTQTLSEGANDYILKPVKLNDILYKVSNLVDIFAYHKEYLEKFQNAEVPAVTFKENEHQFVNSFAVYIESVLGEKEEITIKRMCTDLNVSTSTLERLVRKHYGCNPVKYLAKRRLEKAHHLLNTTTMNVSEIADKLGYNSVSYFSTTYKKYFGKSPLQNKTF